MNKPVTIYLVDDHKIVLEGLKPLIDDDPLFQVIGTSTDSEIAYKEITTKRPDLTLLDLKMQEDTTGLDLMRRLSRIVKETQFIILSMHDDRQYIRDARNAGAAGYLMKNVDRLELLKCLRTVVDGGTYFPRLPAASKEDKPLFTHKELQIVKLVVDGLTSTEIAKRLNISRHTVDVHRKNICRKTNTTTALGLLKFLQEHNITL